MLRFLLAALVLAAGVAHAGEARVAVAANFAAPLARIAPGFTAATGHTLKVSSGATGRFSAQIAAGAPFDVLLSADDSTPGKLVARGHAIPGTQFTYAIGRLALWSAKPGFVDAKGDVLAAGRFKHLAVANAKTAPYGAAAFDVLETRKLMEAVRRKIVVAESIAQAAQFVGTGNAELGFVALSQVMEPGRKAKGSHWVVPAELHRPLRQDAVLLKAGQGNEAATALLAYLKTDAARKVMRSYGYTH